MKDRAPIKDSIDVRNYRNDLKRAVVKRSRVHYIAKEEEIIEEEELSMSEGMMDSNAVEEVSLDLSEVSDDVLATANEIFERLQREAMEDEKAKEDEWIAKLTEDQDEMDASMYNATTGSYSGAYGKGDISDATKEQAANILNKNDGDMFAQLQAQLEGQT